MDSQDQLFNLSEFTQDQEQVMFEQYKLYVELMDRNSSRRHQSNTFFLTVHSILLTIIAGLIDLVKIPVEPNWWIVIAATGGTVFCFTWYRLIRSYQQLNAGKFKVIHQLESKLPAKLFDAEWEALKRGDGSVYTPFTRVEAYIPITFGILYTIVVIGLISFAF